MLSLNQSSHRRFNPLTGEWIVVSPHRTQRPWQGQIDSPSQQNQPAYDPGCYLCPGNERAGGVHNPQYSSTFVFDNDFPALKSDTDGESLAVDDLIIAQPERGICRVGCFSPRHDRTLARMSEQEIRSVLKMWVEQFKDLGSRSFIRYVEIFENRGALMGASNPHPHCQIWGTESIPNEPAKEQKSFRQYQKTHARCLLCDYAAYESSHPERVIIKDDAFLVVVPFWAVWPFETLIVSQRHIPDVTYMTEQENKGLARVLQQLTSCYDELFHTPFPYSMGFHQQPLDGEQHPEWHLHVHFYPPLLRSAGIRKFMVGFEMLGSPQRDITPELAAQRLREVCENTVRRQSS